MGYFLGGTVSLARFHLVLAPKLNLVLVNTGRESFNTFYAYYAMIGGESSIFYFVQNTKLCKGFIATLGRLFLAE